MHDAPENVAHRLEYLNRRMKDPIGKGDNVKPRHPEVFLDESYCHLDHSAANRWVPKKSGIISEPRRKPLLVIFAAFVVSWSKVKKELQAKFVQDSVYIWPAIGKSHLPKETKDGEKNMTKVWAVVKQMVANNTTGKMTRLGLKQVLVQHFAHIQASTFTSLWKLSTKIGQEQLAAGRTHASTGTTSGETSATARRIEEEEQEEENNEVVVNKDLLGEEHWTRALEVVNAADPYNTNQRILIIEPSSTDDVIDEEEVEEGVEEEVEEKVEEKDEEEDGDFDDVNDGYNNVDDEGVDAFQLEDSHHRKRRREI
ncbi:hypothetical protein BGX20_000350 [Mortierella sp. AD010]|nr:hypothetical protein BGX20_000350 [Mortierella sp. AD010]